MSLATAGPDGPWAASVFYVHDGFDLIWLSEPTARHSQNIAVYPHLAVTINADYDDWRQIKGIQLEGRAEAIGPVLSTRELLALYTAKFTFLSNPASLPDTIRRALAKTWFYRIRTTRVYYLDNSQGLGNRMEVKLDPEL
jgi:uncharacterized protein YhbP (UPF0306 family)